MGAGEGVGEGFGVGVQLGVEQLQALELGFQRAAFFGFFFVGVLNQLAKAVHTLVQGVEQQAEAGLVLLGKAFGFFF